jgi:hypothetical protein
MVSASCMVQWLSEDVVLHGLQGGSELQEAQARLTELEAEAHRSAGGAPRGGSGGWGSSAAARAQRGSRRAKRPRRCKTHCRLPCPATVSMRSLGMTFCNQNPCTECDKAASVQHVCSADVGLTTWSRCCCRAAETARQGGAQLALVLCSIRWQQRRRMQMQRQASSRP